MNYYDNFNWNDLRENPNNLPVREYEDEGIRVLVSYRKFVTIAIYDGKWHQVSTLKEINNPEGWAYLPKGL